MTELLTSISNLLFTTGVLLGGITILSIIGLSVVAHIFNASKSKLKEDTTLTRKQKRHEQKLEKTKRTRKLFLRYRT